MVKRRKILTIEYTAIILLWIFVLIFPLLFIDNYNTNWRSIHVIWSECAVVGFVFLVNRFLLMPQLFFSKRYVEYGVALLSLLTLVALFIFHFDGVNLLIELFGWGGEEMESIPHLVNNSFNHGFSHRPLPPVVGHIDAAIPPQVSVIIISAIVVALDMGLAISMKWIISEQRESEIDRERVLSQLSNLKSQVSPHFFMNTLNNIHALVDIDSQRAKQTIIELSALMDYLLYESSSKDRVLLSREVEFINSYINLMRLRFPSDVKIEFSYESVCSSIKIPPLLFLNFIENAFKYGVDYERESFIKIRLKCSSEFVEIITVNSNHSKSVTTQRHGLGIINSRKRLDLLYGDSYTLLIKELETFYVNLKIPII